ncbi:MAG: type II toxin-antitoxin system mRNA interferase toxin, RelE/StbE family [bacterium]
MIEIGYSSSFKKAFKKLLKTSPEIEEKFWDKIYIFYNNPFDIQLKTHKLSGKLKDLWSFSIDFSIRIIFYFESKNEVTFTDIGTHQDVY